MNLISFSAESLSGASYKKLISFLCTISDTVAFTTQTVDRIVDDDDRLYLDNTKKPKNKFLLLWFLVLILIILA